MNLLSKEMKNVVSDICRVSTESWKVWRKVGHFPVWKKNFFGLLVWEKKIIFQT